MSQEQTTQQLFAVCSFVFLLCSLVLARSQSGTCTGRGPRCTRDPRPMQVPHRSSSSILPCVFPDVT